MLGFITNIALWAEPRGDFSAAQRRPYMQPQTPAQMKHTLKLLSDFHELYLRLYQL